jgi:ABC-type multidrug transport system fused ATPase/permease subunit
MKFNKTMHNSLVEKILKAPINLFHDIVPKSHVLHRLSKDLDNSIRFFWAVNSGTRLFFELISCLIIAFLFNIFCVIPYPLMLFMEYRIFLFYIKGGRVLNSLETVTRSPIISNFSETYIGISSIRSFEYQETFRKKYHEKLNDFYRVLMYGNGTSGWFALNLDLVCFFLLFFILTFSWIFEKLVNPIVLGLLIGYTLKMIENTYGFFDQYMTFEKMYSSMDNCEAYTHIVQEKSLRMKNDKFLRDNNFPKRGEIKFINYFVRYRPDTELVLKNINFKINPGEKIGIVGSTGSGKTTLCLGLFRILEATRGQILIDDVDISQIGLELLRDSISFIPQNPKLIDGTLRENIDPLRKYSDEEIIFQLNLIGLAYLLDDNGGLEVEIEANGSNISVGEKQLICIVRAMLKKSKIIIMDEANSSFDYKTDSLIQKCLMKSFQGCTLITIAHKIKTIINHDRIFVLERGELVETGKPEELIAKKKGFFYELYLQSKV